MVWFLCPFGPLLLSSPGAPETTGPRWSCFTSPLPAKCGCPFSPALQLPAIVVALVSHNWWPKASITQIWEPKRLQNGAQNGAEAKRADPHETCAGVSGSHVPPPLGAPFGRLLQRPEKGHPKVNIIPPLSEFCPKMTPKVLPQGYQKETKMSPKSDFGEPRAPVGPPGPPGTQNDSQRHQNDLKK